MKKRLLITIVLLIGAVCGRAQRENPDTVLYGDSRYLFLPMDLDSFDYVWDGFGYVVNVPLGSRTYAYLQYSCIQPVTLYGIAIVSLGRGPTPYRNDVDSSHLDSYACLAQHDDDGILRHVDSARWHPRGPDRYYRFSYMESWVEGADVHDTVMPMYEFYFNRPHTVLGNYYLHLYSIPVIINSVAQWWAWTVVRILSNSSYPTVWCTGDGQTRTLHGDWVGICPIIAPPDTDAIRTLPVEGLRREEHWNGRSVFAWDRTPGQLQYQVAYGPASQPPDSHSLFFAYQPRCSLPVADSLLDPTVQYAVRCRAQSRHACALHDTLVWSPWSDPVEFYPSRPDTALAAITRPPKVEFSLSPNPAHDRVTVLLPDGQAGSGTLLIRDMSGRERHRHRVSGQNFSLPIRDLPAGAYFVTIATGQGCTTQKLIVR